MKYVRRSFRRGAVDDTTGLLIFMPSDGEPVFDDGVTEEPCPKCGARLKWVRAWGAHRYLACSKRAECGWTVKSKTWTQRSARDSIGVTSEETEIA